MSCQDTLHLFDEYQKACHTTATYPKDQWLAYLSLGLAGEAGEFANKAKKIIRDNRELDRWAFAQELGDVLWYISELASHLGIPLSAVASANIKKLADRQVRGKISGDGDKR